MKTKKVLALLLATTMTCSLVGCGGNDTAEAPAAEAEPAAEEEAPAAEAEPAAEEEAPAAEEAAGTGEASIDFEDGVFGFAGVDKSVNSAGDDSALSVEDFNGSKALKVTPQGKASYIGIQADALLGSNAASLKTVEMTIGIENPDGEFGACSGKIYAFTGEDNTRSEGTWSVYLEDGNPKTASIEIPDGFGEGNYIVVSMETDTAKDKGATPANLYIDNIAFKDASGSVLAADTSVEYVSASTGADRSNLCALTNAVEFEGFTASGDGWSQAGATMTPEIIEALVPGSVVEITYTSETGDMWIVMNEAEAGWMRVAQGNADGSGSDAAYINNSKNTAQVTFEQIAALCGDDVSKWGSTMQCEASGAWEVQSVKVGQKAPSYALSGAVEFAGFTASGDGWAQAGAAMTPEIIEALVPGSVVEITYTSDTGDMWIVMNEAEAGWMRVGQGNADGSGSDSAVFDGSKCYVTFEQIAALCGDDVSKWGSTMQCEASGAWEVYGVRVGKAEEFKMVKNLVPFEGFTASGDGWAQAGAAMTPEILEALVPGSVVVITYASDTGDMWVVMNEAEAGWMRVGQGNVDGSGADSAAFDGTTCQVTYEQIAALCGDDVSKWGSTMQCEASGAWEVFSVAVGTAAE
ncbi:MAG: hypothetical protein NC302_07045 [Bacteroidales bacterium]|nr:hypothetical protein [Bacteroidales bacterium]MCM1414721.1 hypothetical protein [bacterium]